MLRSAFKVDLFDENVPAIEHVSNLEMPVYKIAII